MKEDISIWIQKRKSIVGPLVKSSSIGPSLNGKLILISYQFSLEATYIISYRFLREATGLDLG